MSISRREFLQLAGIGAGGWLAEKYRLRGPEMETAPYPLGFYFPFVYVGIASQVESLKKFWPVSGANMLVVDIKNERGDSHIPNDHGLAPQAVEAEAMQSLVNWAKDNGVYLVGRQVVGTDDVLVTNHPDLGLTDIWKRQWRVNGMKAVDLYRPEVAQYHAALAGAAIGMGFNEVQLDYIRFPDNTKTKYLNHRGDNTPESRSTAVAAVLAEVKRAVNDKGGKLGMDVFGYAAWQQFTDLGIGQMLEIVGPYVDVLSPMAYPSTFGAGVPEKMCPGGCRIPTKYPYEIVYLTTLRAKERMAVVNPGAVVRPWIQAYADYRFGQPMGRAQLLMQEKGALDAGGAGVMCWNQRGIYPQMY